MQKIKWEMNVEMLNIGNVEEFTQEARVGIM